MSVPMHFTSHTVTVRRLIRGGGMGDRYAAPVDMTCWVVDEQKIVRDAGGAEVLSNTQVSVNLGDAVPLGSLVTVWPGEAMEREAPVLAISTFRHERLPSFHTLYLT